MKLRGVERYYQAYRANRLPAKRLRTRTLPGVATPPIPRPRDFVPKVNLPPRRLRLR